MAVGGVNCTGSMDGSGHRPCMKIIKDPQGPWVSATGLGLWARNICYASATLLPLPSVAPNITGTGNREMGLQGCWLLL